NTHHTPDRNRTLPSNALRRCTQIVYPTEKILQALDCHSEKGSFIHPVEDLLLAVFQILLLRHTRLHFVEVWPQRTIVTNFDRKLLSGFELPFPEKRLLSTGRT